MKRAPRSLHPLIELLGEALWLRPAVAAAAGLAAGLLLAGIAGQPRWALEIAEASSARTTLITIATGTLAVTATTFGFLVVALQLASTQYSPRSLRSFVRDPWTQTGLAALIGVASYAVGVLLRTGDDVPVPAVAVTVAIASLLLVAGALALLIHHTATSIRIEHLMRSITEDTLDAIADHHPEGAEEEGELPAPPDDALVLPARRSGYVQEVALDDLAEVAAAHDVLIALRPTVGEHVVVGLPLAWAWRPAGGPVDAGTGRVVVHCLDQSVSVGTERTLVQDISFGARQLVDIALRAISPAINDPRTAVEATKHLSRILCDLASRPLLPEVRRDDGGEPLVVLRHLTFDDHLGLACDQIRRFGAKEPDVAGALLALLEDVARSGPSRQRRRTIARHVDLVEQAALRAAVHPEDVVGLRCHAARIRELLDAPPGRAPVEHAQGAC